MPNNIDPHRQKLLDLQHDEEEMARCLADPIYFYNEYSRRENEPFATDMIEYMCIMYQRSEERAFVPDFKQIHFPVLTPDNPAIFKRAMTKEEFIDMYPTEAHKLFEAPPEIRVTNRPMTPEESSAFNELTSRPYKRDV